jgi:hypothetical protein
MTGNTNPGMQCVEWGALLADALDGTLHGVRMVSFEAHQQTCPTCGEEYREATAGMHWLKALEEVEVPRNLVHNIMVHTVGAIPEERVKTTAVPGESWWHRLKGRVTPVFAPVVSPRFAMSFGMAFFSITMLLNVAGFHVSDLKHVDFSSKGLEKAYYSTQARVVRYYENMRLVYEIESRMRDLRRVATPERKQEDSNTPKNPNKSENERHNRENKRYSESHEPVLAEYPAAVALPMHQARLNRRTS